ncbi:MAG: ferredoxin [Planctomycetes bacterium RBG_16_59_8]|nr:MAG: ferredoxin [Planctomycetes bacterium RBG_16_59_8]
MIANYGYKDGSGDYFIVIDTDRCKECPAGECIAACPQGLLERITDDYDDVVCAVKENFRNKLKYACAPCKPIGSTTPPPCVAGCPRSGIRQTW